MCAHGMPCPDASADDRVLAAPISRHPEQGWTLPCNGVVTTTNCSPTAGSSSPAAGRWHWEMALSASSS